MTITVEEMQSLTIFVKQHLLDTHARYEHSIVEHILSENRESLNFRHWIKTHYPEALAEWNALNKIKES
jgi:hypothetical protein